MKIHIKENKYGKFDWAVVPDNPQRDMLGSPYAAAAGWADTKEEAEAEARDAVLLLQMPEDPKEWEIEV